MGMTAILMLAAAVGLTGAALPRLETVETLAADTFEDRATARPGAPAIIAAEMAPGLLATTAQGVDRVSGSVDLVPEGAVRLPPAESGSYLTSAVRVYSFGRDRRRDGRLVTTFRSGGRSFEFTVVHRADAADLVCAFTDGGETQVPYAALPLDLRFSANAKGEWRLDAVSLSDGSSRGFTGTSDFFRAAGVDLTRRVAFAAERDGELTVDNLLAAISRPERKGAAEFPYTAKPAETFDPVKAGWKLTFEDDFEGTDIDWTKWTRGEKIERLCSVADGKLRVKCDYQAGTTNLESVYLGSAKTYRYGYYEARLRFTTWNGWWSAFWLNGIGVGNPFLDGFEIDIYEDYYMKNPSKDTLDHNLHARGAGPLKSWNYNSVLPGSWKDWYTIGCLWTPFEITFYLDGRAIRTKKPVSHSSYGTVTFDAFRHATSVMPLRILAGGKPFRTAYGKHPADPSEKMPDRVEFDFIRYYRWPGEDSENVPSVTFTASSDARYTIPVGELVKLSAAVKPAARTGARIKAVHLFDSGYHLLTRTEPPYEFAFPLTDEFYSGTSWKRPGRQGERPGFDGILHAYSVFAEDEDGMVGHSQVRVVMPAPTKRSSPFRGVARKVPGKIAIGHYDEGGQGVAYFDTTKGSGFSRYGWRTDEDVDATEHSVGAVDSGEWLNYTVDIAAAGRYTIDLLHGTPSDRLHRVNIVLDGEFVGEVTFGRHGYGDWRTVSHAVTDLDLPAGRHILTLQLFGQFNLGDIEIRRAE